MNPSLCIPRVHSNISEKRIYTIFIKLKLGIISKIDIIQKNKEDKFKLVFIHFKEWFREGNALIARERLMNGKEIKVIYDDPWFWKISALREKPKKTHKIPILQLDETDKDETDENNDAECYYQDIYCDNITCPIDYSEMTIDYGEIKLAAKKQKITINS
jgi:hypothetical protein